METSSLNTTITAPCGFKAAGISCGIKDSKRPDLGLLVSDRPAIAAAVFTTNSVKAAPVLVSEEHIRKGSPIYGIVVNSGNANACTGKRGIENANAMAQMLAEKLNVEKENILVASTGIIGRPLNMDKIKNGIDLAYKHLGYDEQAGYNFSDAILTTDTQRKTAYREFTVADATVKIAAAAKGSGMISPSLATMLAFITTDAKVSRPTLQKMLEDIADKTFNRITVDGQMSTNDTVFVLANGLSADIEADKRYEEDFYKNLLSLCKELALKIVADGEGATKVFCVKVINAKDIKEASKIARAIADSLLVKTAIHGEDPNWGRIISAAGAVSRDFNHNKATCLINNIVVFSSGEGRQENIKTAAESMKKKQIHITLDLNDGSSEFEIYASDLSKEYIEINAFYHT